MYVDDLVFLFPYIAVVQQQLWARSSCVDQHDCKLNSKKSVAMIVSEFIADQKPNVVNKEYNVWVTGCMNKPICRHGNFRYAKKMLNLPFMDANALCSLQTRGVTAGDM